MARKTYRCYQCDLECELTVRSLLEHLPDQCPTTDGDDTEPDWGIDEDY